MNVSVNLPSRNTKVMNRFDVTKRLIAKLHEQPIFLILGLGRI